MIVRDAFRHDEDVIRRYWAGRVSAGEMTPNTAARYSRVLASFTRFAAAHGVQDLSSADAHTCERFIRAPRPDGGAPAVSTSRFRLTVVRDVFAALGGGTADPTEGMQVKQGPQMRAVAPLTPGELARLRASGRVSPRDLLRPTAVELALAGGSHLEIAAVKASDLDETRSRVRLGSRWVAIDSFALATLQARVTERRRASRRRGDPWNPDRVSLAMARPLESYPETSIAPGVSSSLSRALVKAGVHRPGVRAASVREFAANRAYAQANRVEDVAALLGLRSLDVAMSYVDFDWQQRYASKVRL